MANKKNLFQLLITLSFLVAVLSAGTNVNFADSTSVSSPVVSSAQTCTTLQPAVADAFIQQEKPAENQGTNNELKVKTETGKVINSVLKFDVSSLPAGALVDSATLSLWVKDVRDSNVTINAHALKKTWTENTVTWSTPWTTPGGDYGVTVDSEDFTKGVKDYWATWNVKTAASAWLSNLPSGLLSNL